MAVFRASLIDKAVYKGTQLAAIYVGTKKFWPYSEGEGGSEGEASSKPIQSIVIDSFTFDDIPYTGGTSSDYARVSYTITYKDGSTSHTGAALLFDNEYTVETYNGTEKKRLGDVSVIVAKAYGGKTFYDKATATVYQGINGKQVKSLVINNFSFDEIPAVGGDLTPYLHLSYTVTFADNSTITNGANVTYNKELTTTPNYTTSKKTNKESFTVTVQYNTFTQTSTAYITQAAYVNPISSVVINEYYFDDIPNTGGDALDYVHLTYTINYRDGHTSHTGATLLFDKNITVGPNTNNQRLYLGTITVTVEATDPLSNLKVSLSNPAIVYQQAFSNKAVSIEITSFRCNNIPHKGGTISSGDVVYTVTFLDGTTSNTGAEIVYTPSTGITASATTNPTAIKRGTLYARAIYYNADETSVSSELASWDVYQNGASDAYTVYQYAKISEGTIIDTGITADKNQYVLNITQLSSPNNQQLVGTNGVANYVSDTYDYKLWTSSASGYTDKCTWGFDYGRNTIQSEYGTNAVGARFQTLNDYATTGSNVICDAFGFSGSSYTHLPTINRHTGSSSINYYNVTLDYGPRNLYIGWGAMEFKSFIVMVPNGSGTTSYFLPVIDDEGRHGLWDQNQDKFISPTTGSIQCYNKAVDTVTRITITKCEQVQSIQWNDNGSFDAVQNNYVSIEWQIRYSSGNIVTESNNRLLNEATITANPSRLAISTHSDGYTYTITYTVSLGGKTATKTLNIIQNKWVPDKNYLTSITTYDKDVYVASDFSGSVSVDDFSTNIEWDLVYYDGTTVHESLTGTHTAAVSVDAWKQYLNIPSTIYDEPTLIGQLPYYIYKYEGLNDDMVSSRETYLNVYKKAYIPTISPYFKLNTKIDTKIKLEPGIKIIVELKTLTDDFDLTYIYGASGEIYDFTGYLRSNTLYLNCFDATYISPFYLVANHDYRITHRLKSSFLADIYVEDLTTNTVVWNQDCDPWDEYQTTYSNIYIGGFGMYITGMVSDNSKFLYISAKILLNNSTLFDLHREQDTIVDTISNKTYSGSIYNV